MPFPGKQSIVRRQKEIARQQRQNEKRARREARRSRPHDPGEGEETADLSPDGASEGRQVEVEDTDVDQDAPDAPMAGPAKEPGTS
jgi:hypothetical protein